MAEKSLPTGHVPDNESPENGANMPTSELTTHEVPQGTGTTITDIESGTDPDSACDSVEMPVIPDNNDPHGSGAAAIVIAPKPEIQPGDTTEPKDKPIMAVPVRQYTDVTDESDTPTEESTQPDTEDTAHRKSTYERKNKKAKNRKLGFRYLDYADYRNYMLVGHDWYLISVSSDAWGHRTLKFQPWSFPQIKRDFANAGRLSDIDLIPRYLGYGCFPSHVAYQQQVNGHFNTYSPLHWQPASGEWPEISRMIRHIFGGQYELGLDYFQLLYLAPLQMLPILVLVSRERQTGKTTFLNFIKEVFEGNAAFVTNETLRSKFNGERASRLLIMCDETFLNKKEDSEKLKALSTARKTYIELKGKDRYEIDNYVKIILSSNNINDPVYIDPEEVRYWVRDVPRLKYDDPNILEAMIREIPAFLDFLRRRQLSVPEARSRMWFEPDQLRTPALDRIVRKCRPSVELDLAEFLLDVMDHFQVDQLDMTNSDLQMLLKINGRDIRDAHRIVCKVWDIPRASNKMAYNLCFDWNNRTTVHKFGRYYTFTRTFLNTLVPHYDTTA